MTGGSGSRVVAEDDHPYDVLAKSPLPDMLSFMGNGDEQEKIWITPEIYHHLYGELSPSGSISAALEGSAATTDIVLISG